MTRSRNTNSTIGAVIEERNEARRELMTLTRAIAVLVESHTRDDDDIGFVVESAGHAAPWISPTEYLEAWKIARQYIGRPVLTRFEREQAEACKGALSKSPGIR